MSINGKNRILCICMSLLSAAVCFNGCQHDSITIDESIATKKELPFTKVAVPEAELLDDTPLGVESSGRENDENNKVDRKLEIPQRTQSSRPVANVSDYPVDVIKGIADPEEEVQFDINLDNAQITEMVSLFAAKEVLNFSYLVDPAVRGAVTVNISTKMKAREVWDTMQHLLWLAGAYASPSYGFINILPFEKMPKERRIFAEHEAQPNVEVLFMPIRYRKSADIIENIRPFLTDGATITDLADSNSVLIVEAPANVNKLQELVKYLDSKGEGEWPVRCYQCREVDSDSIANELQVLLPVLGLPIATTTGPSGGAIKVVSMPRVGCVVVSASLEEVLDEIMTWLKILDRTDMLDKEEIFFYNVKHSTASTLSGALDAFFNTVATTYSQSSSSTSSRASSTYSSTSRNRRTNNNNRNSNNNTRNNSANNRNNNANNQANNPASNSARNNTSNTNRAANRLTTTTGTTNNGTQNAIALQETVFDTEVTIYTDDESNRLTVKTTARTWKMIRAFLERQDVPPRQVSVRATITDISLTKSTEYGISYSIRKLLGRNDQNTLDALVNSMGNITSSSELTSMMSDAGVGILFKDNHSDPLAFLRAIAGEGNTKVLSEPHVLAVSGASAKINVGKKIAIPTETTTYSSDDNMRSNYEYSETGVIMEVTPYITAGNEVRLVISQEVSSAEEQSSPNIPPVIVTKSLNTELVVPDNSTLLMGGMIQSNTGDSHSGIPLLKDIPFLGQLFRFNKKSSGRTELLVLLTVNVIDNKNPQEELIRRYKASLEEIEKNNNNTNMY